MLANDLPPRAATDSKRGFTRQVGQILVTSEEVSEAFGAVDAARGSRQVPQSQCLEVQVFHPVPPAVQHLVVRVFAGLFHQAAALTVAAGMLLQHLPGTQ